MSRVYVGRLPARCTERDIERFFKGYGRLRDIVLKTGYGFVEFEDYKDADDAVYDLHGRDMRGERIIVEHARLPPGTRGSSSRRDGGGRGGRDAGRRYGPPTRTEYRVIVENLSSRVSWQDLKDMMRKAGEVTYADAHKSAKNEGIVEFASYGDMKAAVAKFDDYNLYDRRLKVYEDKPRRRSRTDSRRRSRSRSRSDSPRGSRRSRNRSSNSRDRSRDSDVSRRSRSKSRSYRSDKSPSRRSDAHSRSPSKNGNGSTKNADEVRRSASRSGSGSRQHSPSRSRSASPSRSISAERKIEDEINDHQSESEHADDDN